MDERATPMPKWAQLFAVPAVLVAVWILGQTVGHVMLVFVVSVIVALLLNPLVRMLRRAHIPRGLAVLTVYLSFVGGIVGAAALVYSPVKSQVNDIRDNLPAYSDQAQKQVALFQRWLDRHGIHVDLQQRVGSAIQDVRTWVAQQAGHLLSYSLDVIGALVTLVIVLVASIYMLLDAPRIARFAQRIGGPGAGQFLRRCEKTLTQYVKAQLLVSLIIGVSAGVILWIYGVTGIFGPGASYAVAFAAWVFVMEFVPYIGPILGAIPPTLLALFTSPVKAIWVIGAFVVIHQLEGHVVVPQIMGDAVGVHPLVVIFGLLVGEQVAGLPGVLLALPVVVIIKEGVVFAGERAGVARWEAGERAAPTGAPGPPYGPHPPPLPAEDATVERPLPAGRGSDGGDGP